MNIIYHNLREIMLLMKECQFSDKNTSWSMCKMINVWHFLQAWLPIEQQTRIKMRCFQYIRNMVKGGGKKTLDDDEG